MSQIITIEDPKDYQEGDLFTGTRREGSGTVITVTGKLVKGIADRSRLHVLGWGNLPYVDWQNRERKSYEGPLWEDVTVTREVPDPPKFLEQFVALEVGDHFKRTDGLFDDYEWVKINSSQSVMLNSIHGYFLGSEDWASSVQIEKVER